MHNDQGLPVDDVAAAMRAALARLLVADDDPSASASPA